LVDPTPPKKSEDIAHAFLVSTYSSGLGGTTLVPTDPPPSNEAILFDWGARFPSYIPFQIIFQFCGRDVPKTIFYEGALVSILSSLAWQNLGSPQLAPVT
jgi:hypothetical protein